MPQTTSLELLQRMSTGADSDAWQQFAELYGPLMKSYLRSQGLQDEAAADVSQDVLCILLREIPSFRHNGRRGAFRAWLRAVLCNRLRSFLRSRQRFPRLDCEAGEALAVHLQDPASDPSRRWDREHDRFVVQTVLNELERRFEERTLRAFRMQFLDERSPSDVAACLKMSKGAVVAAKCRVLRALREQAAFLLQ